MKSPILSQKRLTNFSQKLFLDPSVMKDKPVSCIITCNYFQFMVTIGLFNQASLKANTLWIAMVNSNWSLTCPTSNLFSKKSSRLTSPFSTTWPRSRSSHVFLKPETTNLPFFKEIYFVLFLIEVEASISGVLFRRQILNVNYHV